MVLTNAIAFNFLLCLFPLLLVVVARAREQLPPGRRVGDRACCSSCSELIPFEREAMAALGAGACAHVAARAGGPVRCC